MIKPRTMPGVLELLPLDQIAFQRMLDVIRGAFERFGFLPVETPAIEFTDLLLTKSGGETERQVYFVQSTGAREQGQEPDLALRFDLTVPLARYVAEHEHDLHFPFRRYQMQRVYRGERAQRGRFREFYQCDIDVIGKDSLAVRYDAELPAVIHAVFDELAIGEFTIQLNNRKLLRGFFESVGVGDPLQQGAVLREIDKLDKRGRDAVAMTLRGESFGLANDVVERIMDFVAVRSSSHVDALTQLDALADSNETLRAGREELREVLTMIQAFGVPEHRYSLNFSIARGLDYYTGTVFETTLDAHPEIGSICSGGRYDDLASQYTRSKLPGVGISIGASRLFWQLREAGLSAKRGSTVHALVTLLDEGDLPLYLALANELRAADIATEVQLDAIKLARQFKYADRAGIRFVLVYGGEEQSRGVVTIKDLRSGDSFAVDRSEVVRALRVEIAQGEVRTMVPNS
ncbi:MAG: histidine--tRNA ligase [Lysobacterales bacterium]